MTDAAMALDGTPGPADLGIALRRPGPDEMMVDRSPWGDRGVVAHVSVGGRGGGYSFFYKRPDGEMPEYLVHEGRLMRFVEVDTSHPDCPVHRYSIVSEAHVVPDGAYRWVPGARAA